MSTEYTPFLGVGLTYDDYIDVINFLSYYGILKGIDPYFEDLEDVANHCGVHIEYFGMDDIYFVGWRVESDTICGLSQLLNTTNVRWQSKFLSHEPELVHLVTSF